MIDYRVPSVLADGETVDAAWLNEAVRDNGIYFDDSIDALEAATVLLEGRIEGLEDSWLADQLGSLLRINPDGSLGVAARQHRDWIPVSNWRRGTFFTVGSGHAATNWAATDRIIMLTTWDSNRSFDVCSRGPYRHNVWVPPDHNGTAVVYRIHTNLRPSNVSVGGVEILSPGSSPQPSNEVVTVVSSGHGSATNYEMEIQYNYSDDLSSSKFYGVEVEFGLTFADT